LGPKTPGQAEAAVVVEDRFQGMGVGTILVDRLLDYARTHGVRAFVAEVSHENDRMLAFIRHSGLPFERKFEEGVWQIHVHISPEPPAPRPE
jgi:RimJ/RimL family protein N-acetyltransferase